MSINRINDALLQAMDKPPSADGTVFVCHATEDEWDAFVASEDPAPALKTKYLEWFEAAREIHIVEFPSAAHECLGLSVHNIFRTHANANRWLRSRGSSYNHHGRRFEPDCSFGPASSTPGAVLPRRNMEWSDFNTIKVEIGVFQQWGDRAGQLDHKAVAVWYGMPGVEYVLCIKTDKTLTAAEYKLYDFKCTAALVLQCSRRRRPLIQARRSRLTPTVFSGFHQRVLYPQAFRIRLSWIFTWRCKRRELIYSRWHFLTLALQSFEFSLHKTCSISSTLNIIMLPPGCRFKCSHVTHLFTSQMAHIVTQISVCDMI